MNRKRNKNGTFAKEDYSNEIGNKYGKLTIIEIDTTEQGAKRCKCECECGNIAYTYLQALRRGVTKSCGCNMKNESYEMLVGRKFGKLTVIEELPKSKLGQTRFKCHCDCGNDIEVYGANLVYHQTKSCGCVRRLSWYNDSIPKSNKSGVKGVYYHKKTKRWVAKITLNRKVYRKEFLEFDDAVKHRRYLEEIYHKPYKDEYKEFKKDNENIN